MSELLLKNYYAIRPQKQDFKYDLFDMYILDHVNLSDATLKGYRTCIQNFSSYLKNENITQPNEYDIKKYGEYLKNENFTTATKNQYIKAVKHLFIWLSKKGLYPNIAEDLHLFKDFKKIKKDAFTEQDIIKILNDIDTTTLTGKRDYAIMLLIVTGGLRASEVHNLDVKDLHKKGDHYVVDIKGKGHYEKDEYIKVIKPVYDAIQDYLDARGYKNSRDPLFTSTSNRALNKRICPETLSQIFKDRFRASGYDSNKLSIHSLRHSTATILLKSGADLYRVQRHMRHQDPKTTEIYINLNDKEQDTAEQDIYNQIFNASKQKIISEIKQEITSLSEDDLQDILKQIINKKGGIIND